MTTVDIVVTRHRGLIDYLRQQGFDVDGAIVIDHVTDPNILVGRHVVGVLPMHLASLCTSITVVDLNLPQDLRGADLSADQVAQYATGISTYRVIRL
ncbi:MAG: CRISPR-associated protein Csx16 [Bacteroidia bacterium]|nr:CRISPR-associated protein Csx16 [Bacteroidia bacterium]